MASAVTGAPTRSEAALTAPPWAIVVANPAARGVTSELLAEIDAVLEASSTRVTSLRTRRAGDATTLVADAVGALGPEAGAPGTVIAVGGDGTVQEVAEGVARGLSSWPSPAPRPARAAMFIVPAGAGNSAYLAMWPDVTWQDALRGAHAADRRLRYVDLLCVRETECATFLGVNIGLGARVAELLAGAGHVDESVRGAAILQALQDAAAFPGRVVVDGQMLFEGSISQVCIGGVRRFLGGAFEFLPRAELDDGLLDVCVIAEFGPDDLAELGPLVPGGRHIGHPLVRYAKGTSARVERTDGKPLTYEHDGDVRPRRPVVTIDAVPGALPVACAKAVTERQTAVRAPRRPKGA
jgi:diacylglycerol kinase (ATP)